MNGKLYDIMIDQVHVSTSMGSSSGCYIMEEGSASHKVCTFLMRFIYQPTDYPLGLKHVKIKVKVRVRVKPQFSGYKTQP
jgi:hypothetical protein